VALCFSYKFSLVQRTLHRGGCRVRCICIQRVPRYSLPYLLQKQSVRDCRSQRLTHGRNILTPAPIGLSYGDPNGDIDVAADGGRGMNDDGSDVAEIASGAAARSQNV